MSTETTMKVLDFTNRQDPKIVDNVPRPTPKDNEVLIKVVSAAIDSSLKKFMEGVPFMGMLHATPKEGFYLGFHFSGTVQEVGKDVQDLKVGDAVFGHLQYKSKTVQGSFSEYLVVPHEECALKPEKVSFGVAAASATEGTTALKALRGCGGLQKGQRVLVLGAGGGIGNVAVGIAKCLGAEHVTAVCSTKDVARVEALGADEVLDRSKEDPRQKLLAENKKFNVIFDTPGVYPAHEWLNILNPGGAFVTTLPSWGLSWGFLRTVVWHISKKVRMVFAESKREYLELIGSWMQSGKLEIPIDSTFKVSDIKAAIDRQAERNKKGRVVIDVAEGW
eukprot:CAMPEP_0116859256 /NCGR_PEP_ID=MMETSP0418-20121206/21691_1 /TAXON_ID=1158023 /ORGANISM="Astrosyne radiata, Strain 13vi08-1A" /LENGTH=333 /DNA_ID=CAMNT_0004493397 /DNA_START=88 /DNA_END=1089 /DNA_ORIENTATION=+